MSTEVEIDLKILVDTTERLRGPGLGRVTAITAPACLCLNPVCSARADEVPSALVWTHRFCGRAVIAPGSSHAAALLEHPFYHPPRGMYSARAGVHR